MSLIIEEYEQENVEIVVDSKKKSILKNKLKKKIQNKKNK